MNIFAKTYQLTLTRDYVQHWGVGEAARELIQNALDADAPFEFSFKDDAFTLFSAGAKLDPAHLLLGRTSKQHDAGKIGSFGEGFKIALLVLTRLGHAVIVRNRNLTWRPRFEFSGTYGCDLLTIDEQRSSKDDGGVRFIVQGLTPEDVETIRSSCLRMQKSVGEKIATSRGDILLDRAGELYVGDLFVCKTPLRYGYNAKPQHLKLERDRQTVSSFNLNWLTAEMWYEAQRPDEVAQMIYDAVPDLSAAEYNAPQIVKEKCFELFKQRHPGALLAESPQELRDMLAKGLVETVYVGSPFHGAVTSTESYAEHAAEVRPAAQTPAQFLTSWGNANLEEGTLLKKHYEEQVLTAAMTWTAK